MIKKRPSTQKKSLCITAYQKLYQKILTLEFEPGQSLEEKLLMEQLNLGRTPIREALLRLAGEKMVESLPGKGFIVRPITLQNVKSTFEMMKILEIGVVDLMVRHDVTPFLVPLSEASRAVTNAINEKNVLNLVEANHEFHLQYARCSYNNHLIRFLDEIRGEAKRLSYLSYVNEVDPSISLSEHYRSIIREHDDIIFYLKEKNADQLKKTILEHISTLKKRIIYFMTT